MATVESFDSTFRVNNATLARPERVTLVGNVYVVDRIDLALLLNGFRGRQRRPREERNSGHLVSEHNQLIAGVDVFLHEPMLTNLLIIVLIKEGVDYVTRLSGDRSEARVRSHDLPLAQAY